MALLPLDIPAGFYRNGTDLEQSGRWREGSLVRWMDGSLRPVGGWSVRKYGFSKDPVRGMHTWQSNGGTAWVAGGSANSIVVMTGAGVAYELTPDDLPVGRVDANVSTGYGYNYYGTGTYGQPRPVTSDSIPEECTVWIFDNFGETLTALCTTDGRIFLWDLATAMGSELITNGTFATDSDWTKGTNWSITASEYAKYAQYKPTFNADDLTIVDPAADTITITGHDFADGDEITYNVPASPATALGGLTDATNYFIISATANTFQLSATSGGAAIDITPNNEVVFDADDETIKDVANNKIITANTFTNGDYVTYENGGGTDITNLTNDANYFIVNATSSEFQVSATSGGAAIDLGVDPTTTIDPNNTVVGPLNYAVTVVNVAGANIFAFDGAEKPTLQLVRGQTYTFDVSDASNNGHPLGIFDGGTAYTTGVALNGTIGQPGANITFAVPANAPANLTYQCVTHGALMGNAITTIDNAQTIDFTTETITSTAHGLSDGNEIKYSSGTGTDINGLVDATDYFVVSSTADTFQVAATSGGAAINLTAPKAVTVNGSDAAVVDLVNDKIVAANTFVNGEEVNYFNGNGTDITGLTNLTNFFIVNATGTEFQLSATSGGAAIALTALGAGTNHSFTQVIGTTHTFDLDIGSAHKFRVDVGDNHELERINFGNLDQTITGLLPDTNAVTVNADDSAVVSFSTDQIVVANTFATNTKVRYSNGGGANISGLVNDTDYFIIENNSSNFKLASTSGGTAIDLVAPLSVSFDADDGKVNNSVTIPDSTDTAVVDASNDKIIITNSFSDGQQVTYSNNNGTDIAGLANGTTYFIISASGTEFQLSETSGGSAVDITGVGAGADHVFQHVGFTVDFTNDKIITANTFSNNNEVVYSAGSGAAINGLTDGNNYFIVNATSSEFQLASTSGGTPITFSENDLVTIDSTDTAVVDATLDKIITANTFSDGEEVVYSNGGGTDIAGLVNGTNYFIINASSTEFQLAATSGGSAIDITGVGVGTDHVFRQDIGSAHSITFSLGAAHTFTHNIGDDQDSFDLEVTIVDLDHDNNSATVPVASLKLVGTTSTTEFVNQNLFIGKNTFRFGTDDVEAKLEIIPGAYNTPNFYIDNVTLKQKTVVEPITNAPINNKSQLVTEERFIFALGAGGNSRLVSWSDKENINEWEPSAVNESGSIELQTAGQLMQGIRTRAGTLLLTDTDIHLAVYVGPPYVYSFNRIGTHCGTISRLSAIATDQGAFWMGQENFFYFDGNSVQVLPCDVHDYVFGDFNSAQQSKVWAFANGPNNEVWWFYCSESSTEIDRYVAYDYREKHWLIGDLSRTAGVSRGVFAYPFLAGQETKTVEYNVTVADDSGNKFYISTYSGSAPSIDLIKGNTYRFKQDDVSNAGHPLRFSAQPDGVWGGGVEYTTNVTKVGTPGTPNSYTEIVVGEYTPTLYFFCASHSQMGGQANILEKSIIYQHEVGLNYDGQSQFAETGPISLQNGDTMLKVNSVIPDEKTQGDVQMTFKTRFHPNDTERTYGPFDPTNPTSLRFSGRQIRMRVSGDEAADWRVGVMRLNVKPGGRR